MAKTGFEPAEWVSPRGEKLNGNVVINAKKIQRNILRKVATTKPIKLKDHLGFPKTVPINTIYFENNIHGKQTCQTIEHFNKEGPAKIFGNNKTTFISSKTLLKTNYEDFA